MKYISIGALCLAAAFLIWLVIGYFISMKKVAAEKSCIKVKRKLNKNAPWWACCAAGWIVAGAILRSSAKIRGEDFFAELYTVLIICGLVGGIMFLLRALVWKHIYIAPDKIIQPDNMGFAKKASKVRYKVQGDTLQLWFRDSFEPAQFSIIEKRDELAEMLEKSYTKHKG